MRDADHDGSPPRDHWRRYRRWMAVMLGVAIAAVAITMAALYRQGVVLHLHFVLALGLGIALSLLLAGALMGLVFVSSASGHDEAVRREGQRSDEKGRPWGRP